MRIALSTEQFTPEDEPSARIARETVVRLVEAGHDVALFTTGRGHASFGGARVFWASRMTPVSAVREALRLSRPDLCHLLDPHRLGIKVAEAADDLDLPTLVLPPTVWGPGVDLDHHHPGLREAALHDRWSRAHAPDGGVLVVGYAGELSKRKVVSRLVAVAKLPGVRLVALGDGPGVSSLRSAGAKVIPHVTGLERARCLATFDVLVQPRKRETSSPVVLEALASGVPVVAYDHGTARGLVRHGVNGLLVSTERGAGGFARAVAALATDPGGCRTLGAAARVSVADRTWDAAVDLLLDRHYPAALGSATPSERSGLAR